MTAIVAASYQTLDLQAATSTVLAGRRPSLLVAIASYGTAQDHFLEQVVAQYHDLDMDCRIVVLSNLDKPVRGAEVRVGLPSRDTYSLPFAHRKLFLECANDFDLFVYTEDDTLITPANLRAFLEVQQYLREDEIAGFLRSETNPDGIRYIVSANSHFRWVPDSAFSRTQYRFAEFSNQHSGCFIVTRSQLARAIASGGFTVEPRVDRYVGRGARQLTWRGFREAPILQARRARGPGRGPAILPPSLRSTVRDLRRFRPGDSFDAFRGAFADRAIDRNDGTERTRDHATTRGERVDDSRT